MPRPKLPAWGYEYAMEKAKGLRKKYPKGLTGRDLSVEFGISQKGAVNAMNRYNFYTFDKRYRWEDVAVMLTYRQVVRLQQLQERV